MAAISNTEISIRLITPASDTIISSVVDKPLGKSVWADIKSAPIFAPVTVASPKNDPCIVVCAI